MMVAGKPHVVCIPFPAQSHIGAMMKLTKLLHQKGIHITFVNAELNHSLILKARGPCSLDGLPSFQFKTIPDGQPPSDASTKQDLIAIVQYFKENTPDLFLNLIENLNQEPGVPPVTCILSDGFMRFTVPAAQQLRLPNILFWTISASSWLALYHLPVLVQKGFVPLKDESYLTNGYLDTIIDWIPRMKYIRLRDLPSYVRSTDPNDTSLAFCMETMEFSTKGSATVIHTFDALEKDALDSLSQMMPRDLHTVGPLDLLLRHQEEEAEDTYKSIGINMWKEESECVDWLDSKEPGSVIYVNFGSLACITKAQLIEIGWGLANSHCPFLWIVRPDLVIGVAAVLAPEFEAEIQERGLIASWCPHKKVLDHPSVGGFWTHCGWNSTIESLSARVPMICWPFFVNQQTNCHYIFSTWVAGLEIDDVNRNKVEGLVREMIRGEEGMKMKNKAMEWKRLAEEATSEQDGSSSLAFDNLVKKILENMDLHVMSREVGGLM